MDNKCQKAKIKNLEYRLDFQKYNIKEKKKSHKNYKKYIYMKFAKKETLFFKANFIYIYYNFCDFFL